MTDATKKVLTSKIKDYKRDKKNLIPPFGQIKMSQVYWHKEMLPDFLWIDSLVAFYGDMQASTYYNWLLDNLDKYHKEESILTGIISDFALIQESDRKLFLRDSKFLIDDTILEPFKYIIHLYPECPMAWLLEGVDLSYFDKKAAIEDAKKAVMRLYPAKGDHSGFVRALPLNRFFKHKKIFISSKMKDLVASIESYPKGDRYHVESFARNVLNGFYTQERDKNPSLGKWSNYFWKYNFHISTCEV